MGKVTHYDGKLMGRELEWEGSSDGWKENERWRMKATTGMPARMNMQLSLLLEAIDDSGDTGKKTKATCMIEYRVPYPLVGGLIDRFYFRREAQRWVNSAIEGIKRTANQDQLPSIESQLEKRKLDHPGYLPTGPSSR